MVVRRDQALRVIAAGIQDDEVRVVEVKLEVVVRQHLRGGSPRDAGIDHFHRVEACRRLRVQQALDMRGMRLLRIRYAPSIRRRAAEKQDAGDARPACLGQRLAAIAVRVVTETRFVVKVGAWNVEEIRLTDRGTARRRSAPGRSRRGAAAALSPRPAPARRRRGRLPRMPRPGSGQGPPRRDTSCLLPVSPIQCRSSGQAPPGAWRCNAVHLHKSLQ